MNFRGFHMLHHVTTLAYLAYFMIMMWEVVGCVCDSVFLFFLVAQLQHRSHGPPGSWQDLDGKTRQKPRALWPAVEFRMARDWECFKMVHEGYHLCIDDYWCPYVQQDSSDDDDDDDVSVNHMLICCWPLLSHFGHFSNAKMYSSSSTCSTRSSVASMPCACMGWNHPRRPWPSEATKSLCLGPQRDIEMILYIYIHRNI